MHFFFFQAEDGIRDWSVTGVQTCALPILSSNKLGGDSLTRPQRPHHRWGRADFFDDRRKSLFVKIVEFRPSNIAKAEIGRASCRERVKIRVVAERLKKN